ncbi:MAG: alpha/beta hydrolase-fold protein [Candidatus Rokubacteria bacterium]|nr:alpha/beta hydrolase-fold protein [Candidatus Rokubacteria bacterium]
MSDLLETVEIETGREPRAAVIWLHGLGADGHDFEPIVPELGLPAAPALRFIFPHAPLQPVTINGGAVMRAWYDVTGDGRQDAAGVRSSQVRVEALIARERARGVAARSIVLAGFSQGGAVALQTGLRHPERLAGILALSAYLPLPDTLAQEASEANRDVPIFMSHGTQDPVIPLSWATLSRDRLTALGYPILWREYPMPHAVCAEEIEDVGAWLRVVLAPA